MVKKIGVILADSQEYAPFINYFSKYNIDSISVGGNEAVAIKIEAENSKSEIIAVHCGIGKVNAANAAAALIYSHGVDMILNAGLSGAISGVKREDIVAGSEYIECDYDLRAIGYELAVKPDGEEYIHKADKNLLSFALDLKKYEIKSGRFGTGDIFLTNNEKKKELKKLFSLTAFDMETAAIAAVCSKNNAPFLSVRKISDDADDMSANEYREMNDRQEDILSRILLDIIMGFIK